MAAVVFHGNIVSHHFIYKYILCQWQKKKKNQHPIHHRSANKNMPFEPMCYTFYIHFWCIAKTWWQFCVTGFLWCQTHSVTLFTACEFSICLCAQLCGFVALSQFKSWSAKTLSQKLASRTRNVCTCARRTHVCLHVHVWLCVCELQHLHPQTESIISHMSSHETGNDITRQRRCVSQRSPWADYYSGTQAVVLPEFI